MRQTNDDLRFCVYIHKTSSGEIVYIGSGVKRRAFDKFNRSKNHAAIFSDLSVEIVADNLSKNESLNFERLLYLKLKDSCDLFNKYKPSKVVKLSFDLLSKYFYIDPSSKTGIRWRVDNSAKGGKAKRYAGDEAGSKDANGYYTVRLFSSRYKVHRVVWVLHNGKDLDSNFVIDHIDRNRGNNLVSNLRLTSFRENTMNKSLRKDNKTGVSGVKWDNRNNKWVVIWRELTTEKSKSFNPSVLYPDLDFEKAKEVSFSDAVRFREHVLELHYIVTDMSDSI